jgi:signal transduction histidine kinase
MARLERGGQSADWLPQAPATLLQSAAEAIRPRVKDKGIALGVEVPDDLPPVAADAERLGQALANLLDNAIAYTERGGRISLSATPGPAGVTLIIADTGRGIAPEHLPHIFDRFYRIPGQSKEGGTGLGLAIVREIVAAHGGDITCESKPGKGTVFRLRLPYWRAPGGG